MTISKPPLTPNIHSGSKKEEEVFWSNISQSDNCWAAPWETKPVSSMASAKALRVSLICFFKFCLSILRRTKKILWFNSFNSSLYLITSGALSTKLLSYSTGINVLADTNLASKFGNGRIPKLWVASSVGRWSTTKEMKKRNLLIWVAIGWISTP